MRSHIEYDYDEGDVAKSSVMIAHVTCTSLGMLFKLDGPHTFVCPSARWISMSLWPVSGKY